MNKKDQVLAQLLDQHKHLLESSTMEKANFLNELKVLMQQKTSLEGLCRALRGGAPLAAAAKEGEEAA